MFGDDNTNVGIAPSTNFNSPKTRASKLLCVYRKPKKKLKWKKKQLSTSSSAITNAINNFIHMVKEIKLKKLEIIKFITSQMLKNEENKK
jgi:hypothetical protein